MLNAPLNSEPRKPRLTFRIGFVGHRPNRLKASNPLLLANVMKVILNAVKDEVFRIQKMDNLFYSNSNPEFRALSSLAEGSDRTFAEAAMECGFELTCPMPFSQEDYENDFAPGYALEPDSLRRFHELLERAKRSPGYTQFELTGDRNHKAKAYGVCGQMILNQSDLLIIVWDGRYQNNTGGTEDMMQTALNQHIPVIWIDAKTPHHWQLLSDIHSFPAQDSKGRFVPALPGDLTGLSDSISKSLALPDPGTNAGKPEK